MTIHISYNHSCSGCEAVYIPYDQDVVCPKCGLREEERFDFVTEAVKSLNYNLTHGGNYAPKAWATTSHADHFMAALFGIFVSVPRVGIAGFPGLAREYVNGVIWGDHSYLKEYFYNLSLRVYSALVAKN